VIKTQVIDAAAQHLIVSADEPARFEISISKDGRLTVHGYRGTEIDTDQSPVVGFIGGEATEDEQA
jgi:hypothetical protein